MNGIKSDPDVKMDSDVNTPPGSGYMDDDFYEDTGELSIPPKDSEKDVWLTRIPKWLYDAVSNWDDLADGADTDRIVLGEVMAVRDQTGQGLISKDHPMRLFLNPQWQSKSQLPQAYELMPPPPAKVKTPAEAKKAHDEAAASLGHTYIFAEKDLPGYKPSDIGHHRMGGSGNMGAQDPKARIQKRGRYKKAIPKQTTLIGSATREYVANPLPTKEFIEFNKQRIKQAIQGSEMRSNIVDNMNEHKWNQALNKQFANFVQHQNKPKSQLNKAARISKDLLLDMLHKCFDKYMYWPMKALKKETQQPEAYLKDCLEEIADLVRTGTFASNWMRKAMFDTPNSVAQNAIAPALEDEDGDEEEMEDVM